MADYYQNLAIDLDKGLETYFVAREELIKTYKEQGRRKEIQQALKELEKTRYENEPQNPEDLCYLYGKYMEDYLFDVEICQNFCQKKQGKNG